MMKIKPPWNRYRSLLVKISKYLEVNKDAFKIFFYQTIPTSCLDREVSEWLSKLEQKKIVCVDKLDVLMEFFEVEDEFKLLRSIRTFNLWVKTIHFLLADHPEAKWLFSPPVELRYLEMTELRKLFESWRPKTSVLTWPNVYDVYSWATQRMMEVANSTSSPDANSLALEAIAIADFLMETFDAWFQKMNDDELEGKFPGLTLSVPETLPLTSKIVWR